MNLIDIESNKELLLKEYNFAKEKGSIFFENKNFTKGLAYFELASWIAWFYPDS